MGRLDILVERTGVSTKIFYRSFGSLMNSQHMSNALEDTLLYLDLDMRFLVLQSGVLIVGLPFIDQLP